MAYGCGNWFHHTQDKNLPLSTHKFTTTIDFSTKISIVESFKFGFQQNKGLASGCGAVFMAFTFIFNTLMDSWQYSPGQASLRAYAMVLPVVLFFKYDRIPTGFGYMWLVYMAFGCNIFRFKFRPGSLWSLCK